MNGSVTARADKLATVKHATVTVTSTHSLVGAVTSRKLISFPEHIRFEFSIRRSKLSSQLPKVFCTFAINVVEFVKNVFKMCVCFGTT
jgi:hypothetical protein